MGNKYYFLVLILLVGILVAIYFIFDFGVKYYFVTGGIVLWYLLMKDEFSGSNWIKRRTPKPKGLPVIPRPEMHLTSSQPYMATETIKEGYKELIHLCVNDKYRKTLDDFIETLDNYNGIEEDDTVLNYVRDYLDDDSHFYHFIMGLDWKEAVPDLLWRLRSAAQDNFAIMLNLPESDITYGANACVSTDHVFTGYDAIVRQTGLQIGFINTESDEYVIVVHRIIDRNEVENAVNKIGYEYFESQQLGFQ